MTPHPGPDTSPAPNSPAFNIVRAEAAHALVTRLCTLVERAPADGLDAGPAVLRTCLERLETAELDLDLIGSTSLDPDLKTMLASARQTLALAWTRVRASPRLQHPSSSRDTDLPPDDLLDACIRVIANTAEIEYHARSAKFTRNVITKTAHCASVQALMLRINQHFQALDNLNPPSIDPSFDDYQPLLKETEACIHSAVLAYNENTPIRRENMPLHLSPLTSLQAQNNPDLQHFLQTFQDSSEPVSFALLQVPTEEDSGIVIVLAFEHEGAIHCKSVVEPYPYGFLPEHIIAHSRILLDVAQRTAENSEIGPYSADIQDFAVMVAHSVPRRAQLGPTHRTSETSCTPPKKPGPTRSRLSTSYAPSPKATSYWPKPSTWTTTATKSPRSNKPKSWPQQPSTPESIPQSPPTWSSKWAIAPNPWGSPGAEYSPKTYSPS